MFNPPYPPPPPPPRAVLAVTWRHQGVFGIFLAHRNRVCVAQLSYFDNVGWYLKNFPAIRDLLVLGGLGNLEKFRHRPGPGTGQKRQKGDFHSHGGRSGRDAHGPNLIAC